MWSKIVVLEPFFAGNALVLATACEDGTVRVIDLASGTVLFSLSDLHGSVAAHTAGSQSASTVNFALFSPDGKYLATSGSDFSIKIWDAELGTLCHALIGHTGMVRSLSWGPSGNWLASAGADNVCRLWKFDSE
jgi:WD40 repeat protein